jgi:uncharacterized protein YvpB
MPLQRAAAIALVALLGISSMVLLPSASAAAPVDNSSRFYTLDGYGGVHGAGSAPALSASAYWSGWDIARGMALFPDGTGGYTLDGWGGVHRLGSAPTVSDSSHAYWKGFDIARAIVVAPWSSPGTPAGWVLDGWGGIHAFGGAPEVADGEHAYWQGWDIARGLVVFPDSGSGKVSGYILDGYGGLHPFAAGGATMPPMAQATAYWGGWDIARAVAVLPGSHQGYVMDGYGGLHAFAPSGTPLPAAFADGAHAYWGGWDIARGLTTWTAAPGASPGGWTVDGYGGIHAFGSAPALQPSAYWQGWEIAKGGAGAGSGSGARMPTSRTLDVAYHHQDYELSCEEAALQMALGHAGIGVSQTDILNVVGVDGRQPVRDSSGFHWGDPYAVFVGNINGSEVSLTGYGSYHDTISRAATHFGGRVDAAGEGISPAGVYNAILQGHPVVAWVSFDYAFHRNTGYVAFDGRTVQFGAPYEHAATVVGVTPTSVLVYDPWRGPTWMSRGTFESAYAVFNNMAVVID